jgi:hypothetical protein
MRFSWIAKNLAVVVAIRVSVALSRVESADAVGWADETNKPRKGRSKYSGLRSTAKPRTLHELNRRPQSISGGSAGRISFRKNDAGTFVGMWNFFGGWEKL